MKENKMKEIIWNRTPSYFKNLNTCRKQWKIGRGGERVSGISMLMACHDDDDDDLLYSRNTYANHTIQIHR